LPGGCDGYSDMTASVEPFSPAPHLPADAAASAPSPSNKEAIAPDQRHGGPPGSPCVPPRKELPMSIADKARKIPGVAAIEGALTGAIAGEQDLPIKDYDKQTAADIAAKLKGLSQRELRMIDAYERKHENRATITDRIAKLSGDEPWSGYDEQSVDEITSALREADEDMAKAILAYERDHKARAGVIQAAEQRIDSK
jgi:hypothetical protein